MNSVNQYIMLMPSVSLEIAHIVDVFIYNHYVCFFWFQYLYLSMDQYLHGLFLLANDPAPEVRKLVSYAHHNVISLFADDYNIFSMLFGHWKFHHQLGYTSYFDSYKNMHMHTKLGLFCNERKIMGVYCTFY